MATLRRIISVIIGLLGLLTWGWLVVHVSPMLVAGDGEPATVNLVTDAPVIAPISGERVCRYHLCVTAARGLFCAPGAVAHRFVEIGDRREEFSVYEHDGLMKLWHAEEGGVWAKPDPIPQSLLDDPSFADRWPLCRDAADCKVEEYVTRCPQSADVRLDRKPWGLYVRPREPLGFVPQMFGAVLVLAVLAALAVRTGWRAVRRSNDRT